VRNQFSSEYVEFVLRPEAKCFQDGWMPAYGDWCVQPEWSMDPALVVEPDRVALHETFWLATLWDLVQIIEGTGCTWERGTQGLWRLYTPFGLLSCTFFERAGQDGMLCAANLALRALEAVR
jgi:hypothetical protein